MLKRLIDEGLVEARGIVGFFPASTVDLDDIEVYDSEDPTKPIGKFMTLRQQLDMDQESFVAMSDFIAPKESGVQDYIGGFACSAGFKADELCQKFVAEGDDYNNIMVKALTDRLAEAFSEYLHVLVRKELWGYAPDEDLTPAQCLNVQYQGIRPAPGYPSQPDHTEKLTMWELFQVKEKTGIELTESLAMSPASSVSGLYFANPNAYYFAVQEVCKDQINDYARRKNTSVEQVERWLGSILSYDTSQ